MVKNILSKFLIGILVAALLGVLYLVFADPFIRGGNYTEIRFYVRFFLLLLAIAVFGILRAYNATVTNTRFLIKLQKLLGGVLIELPKTNKALSDDKLALKNLRESMIKNVHSLQELGITSEKLSKALETFKRNFDA